MKKNDGGMVMIGSQKGFIIRKANRIVRMCFYVTATGKKHQKRFEGGGNL